MADLTSTQATKFLNDLNALSKAQGIALVVDGNLSLAKADTRGSYKWVAATFTDGTQVFDQIIWTEPTSP